jgi:hypothetical protein
MRVGVTKAVLLAGTLAVALASQAPDSDPFAFFDPTVRLSVGDRARLDRRDSLVRTVKAGERDVAVFSAVQVDIDANRLVEWVRRIERLKQSSFVQEIGRFSDPPRLEDLAGLTIDRKDLDDLRRCRPGDCGIKLSAEEMTRLTTARGPQAAQGADPLQEAFRLVLFNRVTTYLRDGLTGFPPYHDSRRPVSQAPVFDALLDDSPFLADRAPVLADFLRRFPGVASQDIESFIYWSKETPGGRPVVSLTHVTIVRGDGVNVPEALVASKQIYASHYMNGSLAVTALVGSGTSPRYLAYLNRSRLDLFSGLFGGMVRRIVVGRLRSEAGEVVDGLRRRLESGPVGSLKSEF